MITMLPGLKRAYGLDKLKAADLIKAKMNGALKEISYNFNQLYTGL